MKVPLHWSLQHKETSPIYQKLQSQMSFNLASKKDFFGKAPSIFVGRFGYPNINVGFLSVEKYNHNDEPLLWSKDDYSIKKIIDLRTQLVNSRFSANVKDISGRYTELSQEVAMSDKPADMEINLIKRPQFKLSLQQDAAPHGPSVNIIKADITENPHIPTKIDKIVSDTDLLANEGINTLFSKGVDEHYLTRLLSAGTLGIKRKLVPTRWSITAVDDNVGKRMLQTIRTYDMTGNLAYFGSHLGNYFIVLFLDDLYSYELFEAHYKSPKYTTDHESFSGRTKYAEQCAGGYYAARLPALEIMEKTKKQSSVLVIRIITDEYYAPLGVWVVREAVRKALANKPIEFSSKELMFEYAKKLTKKKFNYDISQMLSSSILIKEVGVQKRLGQY